MNKLMIEWSELSNFEKKSAGNAPMRVLENVLSHPKYIRQKINGESWD